MNGAQLSIISYILRKFQLNLGVVAIINFEFNRCSRLGGLGAVTRKLSSWCTTRYSKKHIQKLSAQSIQQWEVKISQIAPAVPSTNKQTDRHTNIL